MSWVILAAYITTAVFAARKAAVFLLDTTTPPIDREDRYACRFFGLIIGICWPIVLLVALVFYRAPKSRAELKAERDALQDSIKDLERENARLQAQQERRH